MGRIQSDTGLITGIPITETIDKLMALASKPVDRLKTENTTLTARQTAVTDLSALLLSVQYLTKNLGKASVYNKQQATSSNANALSATVTGSPAIGTYQFTPVRMVSRQQVVSSGFKTTTDTVGSGKVTFRFGDNMSRSAQLGWFNGGEGIDRGQIRITDRSGVSAQIDLSTAQTVDDVLTAINSNSTINVTAVAEGGHIRLMDNTGQALSNLKVQEVGGGTTAASLGLDSVNAASNSVAGSDVVQLYSGIELNALNDGAGVSRDNALDDIQYTLRNGTTGTISTLR